MVERARIQEMRTELRRVQDEVLHCSARLSAISATLLRIAAECPGGRLLDVPGAAPRDRARRPRAARKGGEKDAGRG